MLKGQTETKIREVTKTKNPAILIAPTKYITENQLSVRTQEGEEQGEVGRVGGVF